MTIARWMDASHRLPFDPISIMHWLVNQNVPVYADQFPRGTVGAIIRPYSRAVSTPDLPCRNCRAAIQEFPE